MHLHLVYPDAGQTLVVIYLIAVKQWVKLQKKSEGDNEIFLAY